MDDNQVIDTQRKLIEQLIATLKDAERHLDYCGYGDSWERSCARESGLAQKIRKTLDDADAYLMATTPEKSA